MKVNEISELNMLKKFLSKHENERINVLVNQIGVAIYEKESAEELIKEIDLLATKFAIFLRGYYEVIKKGE